MQNLSGADCQIKEPDTRCMCVGRSAAAQLLSGRDTGSLSSNSSSNTPSRQKLRSLLATTSTSSSSNSSGYYAWVGTELGWGPRVAAPPSRGLSEPGAIAAVVLGSVLGLIIVLAVVALFLQHRRQRVWGAGRDKSCLGLCWAQKADQQLLATGGAGGSSHADPNSSWALHAPGSSALRASFGSVRHGGADSSVRGGQLGGSVRGGQLGGGIPAWQLGGSVHSDGAAWNAHFAQHAFVVHTSPNSATTAYSLPRGVAGDGRTGSLYDLVQHHQPQQHGLEVEQAGPSNRPVAGHAGPGLEGLAASAAAVGDQQQDGTEGTGADAAEGRLNGAGGQHKQQVFEAARRQLGATAGDLARSDALVLESVLGEGSFGKVFRGERRGTCMRMAVTVHQQSLAYLAAAARGP